MNLFYVNNIDYSLIMELYEKIIYIITLSLLKKDYKKAVYNIIKIGKRMYKANARWNLNLRNNNFLCHNIKKSQFHQLRYLISRIKVPLKKNS